MPFEILEEKNDRYPVVVSIPHSGTFLPQEMRSALLPGTVLANTDWFLPELYAFLPRLGVTTLINHVSRYAVDVNRDPNWQGGPDSYTRSVVYERTTWERPMYARPLTAAQIQERITAYHTPYHSALKRLLDEKIAAFGRVFLFDLHSFMGAYHGDTGADVVLGSAEGKACTAEHLAAVRTAMERNGYTVSCDRPFGGGYITRHYGGGPVDALLVELRYTRYLQQRVFIEEVLFREQVDDALFFDAVRRMQSAFLEILENLSGTGQKAALL